jgi:hypothetical protein
MRLREVEKVVQGHTAELGLALEGIFRACPRDLLRLLCGVCYPHL